MAEGYYKITQHWQDVLTRREKEMSQSTKEVKENYEIHARRLSVLPIGIKVAIQDVKSKCWDRSEIVIEANNFRQYVIKVDGSGRLLNRNRRHLRSIKQALVPIPEGVSNTPGIPHRQQLAPLGIRRGTRERRPPTWQNQYVCD